MKRYNVQTGQHILLLNGTFDARKDTLEMTPLSFERMLLLFVQKLPTQIAQILHCIMHRFVNWFYSNKAAIGAG